jgi:hypothetical protein
MTCASRGWTTTLSANCPGSAAALLPAQRRRAYLREFSDKLPDRIAKCARAMWLSLESLWRLRY